MGDLTFFPTPNPYLNWMKLIGPFLVNTWVAEEDRPVTRIAAVTENTGSVPLPIRQRFLRVTASPPPSI